MLVSTNRTRVELLAAEAVAGTEARHLGLDVALLGLEAGEFALALRERAQVVANKGAERGPALGGADPRGAVDVIGHGDGDALHVDHSITASRVLWLMVARSAPERVHRDRHLLVDLRADERR